LRNQYTVTAVQIRPRIASTHHSIAIEKAAEIVGLSNSAIPVRRANDSDHGA
jgi:hypothetical protein